MSLSVRAVTWALLSVFFLFSPSVAKENENLRKIIVKTLYSQRDADRVREELARYLDADPVARRLHEESGFRYAARPSGKFYIVAIEPLRKEDAKRLLPVVRRRFADAFSNRYIPPVTKEKERPKPVEESVQGEKEDEAKVTASSSRDEKAVVSQKIDVQKSTEAVPAVVSSSKAKSEKREVDEPIDPQAAVEAVDRADEPEIPMPSVETATIVPPKPQNTGKQPLSSKTEENGTTPSRSSVTEEGSASSSIGKYRQILIYLSAALGAGLLLLSAGWLLLRRRHGKKEVDGDNRSMGLLVAQMDRPFASALEGMNHAIRNLYERVGEDETAKKELKRIEQAGRQIETALADVKDIAALAAGNKPEVRPRRFDLNDILEQLAETFSCDEAWGGVALTYDVDTAMPIRFVGDGKRLKRLLCHTLHAAALRMRRGTAYLSVHEERDESSEDESRTLLIWKLVCRSDGTLAAPSEEALWHSDLGTKLAEAMGARIDWMEEERGMVWKMEIEMEIYDVKNRRKYHLPSRSYMQKRIFIVDPDKNAAKSLEKMLRFFHYQVRYLASLEERDRRQREPWDMLFIDEAALRGNHVVSLAEMKKRMARKVVVVARPKSLETLRYEFEEADGFLARPFTHRQLLGLIVRQFGQHWY
ncbi:MAG: hypothetical protein GXO33_08320 [Epsilonproteobacteria bacterium]|nr:hypothetical protein [Campylobacterota bacterium]